MTKIKFLTAGESHGKGLLGIVEGIPSHLEITEEYMLSTNDGWKELKRQPTLIQASKKDPKYLEPGLIDGYNLGTVSKL